jgi:hypothetical protein
MHYLVELTVTNTDRSMLRDFAVAARSGKIYGRRKIYSPRHSMRWDWKASARQAEFVLRRLLPYLHGKRREAALALQARSLIGPQGSRGIPNADKLERLVMKIRSLKSCNIAREC